MRMKLCLKLFSLLIAIHLISACEKDDPNVVKFRDDDFLKELIKQGVDKNGDGKISPNEAEITSYLIINIPEITDLTGIEAFAYLTGFSIRSSGLTHLDLSENLNLEWLDCGYCSLTSLKVSNNIALKSFSCGSNKLTKLDVSKNINLEYLDCSNNQLTILDVTNNKSLKNLNCGSNMLTLLDISENVNLESLACFSNPLNTLDVSKNSFLENLNYGETKLNPDLSNLTGLLSLSCFRNDLTSLDVSNKPKLKALYCYSNLLTDLDLSKNPELATLWCGRNLLTGLNISKNTKLNELTIDNMPTLTKVCVWKIPLPLDFFYNVESPNMYWSLDCGK